jgi:hypothetical protein
MPGWYKVALMLALVIGEGVIIVKVTPNSF